MKLIIASMMIIGMSLALLWHFTNIAWYGEYIIKEVQPVVLLSEFIVITGFLLFGIYLFVGGNIIRLALICFVLAGLGLLDHYRLTGLLFQWEQLFDGKLHHETLIAGMFILGVLLVLRRVK